MNKNKELIEKFYSSFQKLDSDGMVECYHENIQFSDPAFPNLKDSDAGNMWKMLCSQAQEFELSFSDITADETTGSAYWEAKYLFSMTGRKVHNKIDAAFKFQDGKIIQHSDQFNFWKWSSMALGPIGILLGWSPLLKNKVRKQAANNLKRYITKLNTITQNN